MFGAATAGGPHDALSSSPNWTGIDKDISKLLEDVPRATSAPPHLQDRWNPVSSSTGTNVTQVEHPW